MQISIIVFNNSFFVKLTKQKGHANCFSFTLVFIDVYFSKYLQIKCTTY